MVRLIILTHGEVRIDNLTCFSLKDFEMPCCVDASRVLESKHPEVWNSGVQLPKVDKRHPTEN